MQFRELIIGFKPLRELPTGTFGFIPLDYLLNWVQLTFLKHSQDLTLPEECQSVRVLLRGLLEAANTY